MEKSTPREKIRLVSYFMYNSLLAMMHVLQSKLSKIIIKETAEAKFKRSAVCND